MCIKDNLPKLFVEQNQPTLNIPILRLSDINYSQICLAYVTFLVAEAGFRDTSA